MNTEDFIRQFNQQQSNQVEVPVAKLDEFIDKCLERDETLLTLGQSLSFKLQYQWHSPAEGSVLPLVIQRIQQRINEGAK
jgi:hypothetical protein